MQGASKDIPHAVCWFTHSSQKTIKVMTIMTLSWVDPVGRSELGIQEPQHTYSFPLGLTQILGSHLQISEVFRLKYTVSSFSEHSEEYRL